MRLYADMFETKENQCERLKKSATVFFGNTVCAATSEQKVKVLRIANEKLQ